MTITTDTDTQQTDAAAPAPREPKDYYANLRTQRVGDVAGPFVHALAKEIGAWERANGKRAKGRRKTEAPFVEAISRFVADLLRARFTNNGTGRCWRPIGKTAFEGEPVSYDQFTAARKGLEGLGLIDSKPGVHRYGTSPLVDRTFSLVGTTTRFWATDKLIAKAGEYGITGSNVTSHFRPELPEVTLWLRLPKRHYGPDRVKGRLVQPADWPLGWHVVAAEVQTLNEFLSGFTIEGGQHFYFMRGFNRVRSFRWDKGGRLYSEGGDRSFQQMSGAERRLMTIDGEPVVEVDIRASQPTIYHAMLAKVPFVGPSNRDDPYALKGLDRGAVKTWMTNSIGLGKPVARWSKEAVAEHSGDPLPKASAVRDVVTSAYPAMERLGEFKDVWADLMFLEAQVIITTMVALMAKGVPSLSVYDSIIVQCSQETLARDILRHQFKIIIGVTPILP